MYINEKVERATEVASKNGGESDLVKDAKAVPSDTHYDNGETTAFKNTPSNIFRFNGKAWTLQFADVKVIVKNRLGLHYICVLINRKFCDVHSSELVTKYYGESPDVMPESYLLEGGVAVIEPEENYCDKPKVVTTPYRDEILSDEDRQFVLDQLEKAQVELDAIKTMGYIDKIEAKEDEIATIEKYLRSTRFEDKNIHFNDCAERDRKSVAKAIKQAIALIKRSHPMLADHLRLSITTGLYCCYIPEKDTQWGGSNQNVTGVTY